MNERVFHIQAETPYDFRKQQCISIRSFPGVKVTREEYLKFCDAFLEKYQKYVHHVDKVSQFCKGDFCCIVSMDIVLIPEQECRGLTRDGQIIPYDAPW